MAAYILLRRKSFITTLFSTTRTKSTSAPITVASRVRDPNFDNLMDLHQNYHKVVSIQQLILADLSSSSHNPPSISISLLNALSNTLRIGHPDDGPTHFLSQFPHIFHLFYYPAKKQYFCRLTQPALQLSYQERDATMASLPFRALVRVLSMSVTKSLPLSAVSNARRELGLPLDFEDSVILRHPHLFELQDDTDMLKLVKNVGRDCLVAAVEDWRVVKYCSEDCDLDRSDIRYCFSQSFPRGMRFDKGFRANVNRWQRLAYVGPYDDMGVERNKKARGWEMEKRAVAVIHEFLSITVEKMLEVEKINEFTKWFGIDFNVRDLVLDHPGMFYLSTKCMRHTVFLREAYERGRLIVPNPVYDVRMKLLDFVLSEWPAMIKDLNELDIYEKYAS